MGWRPRLAMSIEYSGTLTTSTLAPPVPAPGEDRCPWSTGTFALAPGAGLPLLFAAAAGLSDEGGALLGMTLGACACAGGMLITSPVARTRNRSARTAQMKLLLSCL